MLPEVCLVPVRDRDSSEREEDESDRAACPRDRVEAPGERRRRRFEDERVPAGEPGEHEPGGEAATGRLRPAAGPGEQHRLGRPRRHDRGPVECDGDRNAHERGGDAVEQQPDLPARTRSEHERPEHEMLPARPNSQGVRACAVAGVVEQPPDSGGCDR